jgi:hypothetical protein
MAGKIKYLHVDTIKLKKPSMKIDGFFVGMITGSSNFLGEIMSILHFVNY